MRQGELLEELLKKLEKLQTAMTSEVKLAGGLYGEYRHVLLVGFVPRRLQQRITA
jgi:hypothetical protein